MAHLDERERARRLASQRNLGAMANDTKWGELFAEAIARRLPLDIKLLDGPEVFHCPTVWSPSKNYIEGGDMGPYLFAFLEHVASSEVDDLAALAKTVGLECIVEGDKATIYGYK